VYVAVLTKSLCIAQDFLTAIWLCWSSEQGQFRESHSSKWWKRHRPDASFPQAMTVIVLAAVGFLACVFFLFVLFQWTRDTRRKTTTVVDAAGETSEKKRPHIVGSRRTVEKRDRFWGRSRWVQSRRSREARCGPGCNECERIAYEKVARSLRSGRRT
jgi:hypothetical protein